MRIRARVSMRAGTFPDSTSVRRRARRCSVRTTRSGEAMAGPPDEEATPRLLSHSRLCHRHFSPGRPKGLFPALLGYSCPRRVPHSSPVIERPKDAPAALPVVGTSIRLDSSCRSPSAAASRVPARRRAATLSPSRSHRWSIFESCASTNRPRPSLAERPVASCRLPDAVQVYPPRSGDIAAGQGAALDVRSHAVGVDAEGDGRLDHGQAVGLPVVHTVVPARWPPVIDGILALKERSISRRPRCTAGAAGPPRPSVPSVRRRSAAGPIGWLGPRWRRPLKCRTGP